MGWWIGATAGAAVACLAAARYLSTASWVVALWGSLGCAVLTVGLLLGWIGRRALGPRWQPGTALVLAAGAMIQRIGLALRLQQDPTRLEGIDPPNMTLVCGTIVWAALALTWGALALADALDDTAARTGPRVMRTVLAAGTVTLSLYALAPIFPLLGIHMHPAVIVAGLACLATLAYGSGIAARRWSATRRRSRRNLGDGGLHQSS